MGRGASRAATLAPLLLALALPILAPPPAALAFDGATVSVALRATAEVAADVIRIRDLAAACGDERVGRVVIAFAPPVGGVRHVSRQAVASALAGRFPMPIAVGGARAASVVRAAEGEPAIEPAALLSLARDALVARRADLADAGLELELLVDPARLPRGEAESVEVSLSGAVADRIPGRGVAVYAAGFRRAFSFAVGGTATRRVWRAKRALAKGGTVGAEDASLAVERHGLGTRLGLFPRSPVGLAARGFTAEGAPLSADRLEKVWCVKKGDKVTLRSDNELIRVEMPALALGTGDAGDVIEARNLKSGRTVKAVVRGPGELVTTGVR